MFETVGFALIALCVFAINDLIFKSAAQKGVTAHHMMMVLVLAMLPAIALFGIVTETLVPHPGALWGAVGGCFSYFAFYNFSKALQQGAVSVAVPVFRLFFLGTAILSIAFLGEALSALKVVGLILGVVAVWLLLFQGKLARIEISREAVIRVVGAAMLGSFPFFFFKIGLIKGATMPSVIVSQAITVSIIATVAVYLKEGKIRASNVALKHGVTYGVLQAFGFGILLQGMVRGEASVLVPIAQLSFVVTALVGLVLWKEALTLRKAAGIGTAVGAVTLLGIASNIQ